MSDAPAKAKATMGIDPFERNWMVIALVLILAFGVTVAVAGFALGFQVPGEEARVDPNTVADTPPSTTPGSARFRPASTTCTCWPRPGRIEPRDLTFPQGAEVTFYITSVDVQHGFKLQDTNVNVMVIPGEVSKLTTTFDRVGEYPFICHEYCGPAMRPCSARSSWNQRNRGRTMLATETRYELNKDERRFIGAPSRFRDLRALPVGSLFGPLQAFNFAGWDLYPVPLAVCSSRTTRA